MTNTRIDKKAVRNEAKQLLRQGSTRQETFNELKEKYKYAKDVADIIKYLPSNFAKRKYGLWNYILLALLILTAAFYMITAPSLGIIVWYGLLIFIVAGMYAKYYLVVTLFYLLGTIGAVAGIMNSETVIWANMIVFLIATVPSLILPIWVSKRLCPPPLESKEMYVDSKGQKRLRIVYQFID